MNKKHSILLAIALALLYVLPATAIIPPQPAIVYGTVTMGGAKVAEGSQITASINGVTYAETSSITYQGNSVYSLDVPGDDLDTPEIEGGSEGDRIIFKIDGQQAEQTAAWQQGSNIETNLTATQSQDSPETTLFLPFLSKP